MLAITAMVLLVALGDSSSDSAMFRQAGRRGAPVLLLMELATTPGERDIEERFDVELHLALEGVRIERVRLGPDPAGFAVLPLEEQIRRSRSLAVHRGAAAVAWLEMLSPYRRLTLNILTTSGDLTSLTRVETPTVPGCEASLALVARELMRGVLRSIYPERRRDITPAVTNPDEPLDAAGQARTRASVLSLRPEPDVLGEGCRVRFSKELQAALQRVGVDTVEVGLPGTAALSSRDLVELVGPSIGRHVAVAATWLRTTARGGLRLYVVATSAGRAVIWEIRSSRAPGAEAALVERVVFWIEYLLRSPHRLGLGASTLQMAAAARSEVAGEARQIAPRWALSTLFLIKRGVLGHQGPASLVGGGLTLELGVWGRLAARIDLQAYSGPHLTGENDSIRAWEAVLGAGLFYGWDLGPLRLGPRLSLQGCRSGLTMELGEGPERDFVFWNLRASLGAEVRWLLSPDLALAASLDYGAFKDRHVYLRRSDGTTVLASPWDDVVFSLGLRIVLDEPKADR